MMTTLLFRPTGRLRIGGAGSNRRRHPGIPAYPAARCVTRLRRGVAEGVTHGRYELHNVSRETSRGTVLVHLSMDHRRNVETSPTERRARAGVPVLALLLGGIERDHLIRGPRGDLHCRWRHDIGDRRRARSNRRRVAQSKAEESLDRSRTTRRARRP
jgi:hypothetical protein